jgi:peptidoglycan-N-acetylglucosamine deacetylase
MRGTLFAKTHDNTIARRITQGVFVTTSWDDGHVLDHQLAGMLESHGLPATFYIAPLNVEIPARERIGDRGTRSLAERFEIGGHTLRHVRLTGMPPAVAQQEILDGKDYLEELLGKQLSSFCYVGGLYGPEHVGMVRQAGFRVARTVIRHDTALSPAMELATTTHAGRHLRDGRTLLRSAMFDPAKAGRMFLNWDELAMQEFDEVLVTGGIYHLWGRSWEIALNRDWDRLDRVLAHISGRPGVSYVTNGRLPTTEEPSGAGGSGP